MSANATQAEYDLEELYDAYHESKSENGAPFAAWSLFHEAYGENARRDFLAALDNGDISIYEQKAGIRADGSWPRFNTGCLWLEFDF